MTADTKFNPVMMKLRKQWLDHRKIAPYIAEDLAEFLDDAPTISLGRLYDAVARHRLTVDLYGDEPPLNAVINLSAAVSTVLRHCFEIETIDDRGRPQPGIKM